MQDHWDRLPPAGRRSATGRLRGAIGHDLGIDLGTANTLIFVRGRGVVLAQPSYVAIDTVEGALIAAGEEAREMLGRAPASIEVIRPLHSGVISDLDAAQAMLREFILRAHHRRRWAKPRVVICVPSGVTMIERRAVEEAALQSGARHVQIVSEPLAAAIGAGLPVDEPRGSMIVDVGGGTTEVAVLVLGSILASTSLRVAGDAIDAAIVNWIRKQRSVLIGDRTAEKIKTQAASAWPGVRDVDADVVGRDLTTGRPKRIRLTADQIREAVAEPIDDICDAVVAVFDRLPPEIVRDIAKGGIVLTGGGALLAGLDRRLARDVGVRVWVDNEPLTSVVRGAGILLDRLSELPTREPGLVRGGRGRARTGGPSTSRRRPGRRG
jgi:rod shape-determining protein MreB